MHGAAVTPGAGRVPVGRPVAGAGHARGLVENLDLPRIAVRLRRQGGSRGDVRAVDLVDDSLSGSAGSRSPFRCSRRRRRAPHPAQLGRQLTRSRRQTALCRAYSRWVRIPQVLAQTWTHEPGWLAELPQLATECAELWGLQLESPIETPHSLVVPAGRAVLKLNAPSHLEADHEPDALARWDGNGAVRLLARDDRRRAFLLERCVPGTRLWEAGVDDPAVITDLLPRLRVDLEQAHPFRLLAAEAEQWTEEIPARYKASGRPFERSLLDFAVDVYTSVDRTATALVNQDLHGGNVLMAERRPWLVIDPKPLAGESELDGVGLLRNAATRSDSPGREVRRWLDALASLGLDRERLRGWGTAHTLAWGYDARGTWHESSVSAARAIRAA